MNVFSVFPEGLSAGFWLSWLMVDLGMPYLLTGLSVLSTSFLCADRFTLMFLSNVQPEMRMEWPHGAVNVCPEFILKSRCLYFTRSASVCPPVRPFRGKRRAQLFICPFRSERSDVPSICPIRGERSKPLCPSARSGVPSPQEVVLYPRPASL